MGHGVCIALFNMQCSLPSLQGRFRMLARPAREGTRGSMPVPTAKPCTLLVLKVWLALLDKRRHALPWGQGGGEGWGHVASVQENALRKAPRGMASKQK